MDNNQKIVDFTYCRKCKYWSRQESGNPCYYCLSIPVNSNSHKPVYFVEETNNFHSNNKSNK